ncbi:MAG: sulfurtransferase complex subunit TusB [Spirochaetia bacterium]|nr:sulfurtransferase complex subunit TusB [Spirochaetia bacterium]
MLHTINKSPFSSKSLDLVFEFAAAKEPVLLYEDGVYAAQSGTKFEPEIARLLKTNPVYALQADLKARAINNPVNGIKVINYDGFVDLVAEHKVQNWL